jgi:hypothetical protein
METKRLSNLESELLDQNVTFEGKPYQVIKLVNSNQCVVCKDYITSGPCLGVGYHVNGVCHVNCFKWIDLRMGWHHELPLAVNYLEQGSSLPIPIRQNSLDGFGQENVSPAGYGSLNPNFGGRQSS